MKFSGCRLLMLWVSLIALACPFSARAEAAKGVAPDAEMQSGIQSFRQGDFAQALQHWNAAAAAYEAAGNAEGQARALVRAAELLAAVFPAAWAGRRPILTAIAQE